MKSIRKMMKFTQNNLVQHDIMNRIIKLTKWGSYTIHDVIPKKVSEMSL